MQEWSSENSSVPLDDCTRIVGMDKRVIALAAILAAACGGPAAPSPAIRSIEIVGLPSTINLGDVVTLQAVAALSNGTSVPLQHPAWSSSNTKPQSGPFSFPGRARG
jgi:hypothetical protein